MTIIETHPGIAPVFYGPSRPIIADKLAHPETEKERLYRYARGTWGSLERMFGTPTGLIDDKILPSGELSGRTSISNIGLGMVAVIAARDLGIITDNEAAKKISTTLDIVEDLPRFQEKYLYTWYSTITGEPSVNPENPIVVSTVDMGQIACALMVVQKAAPDISLQEKAHSILMSLNLDGLYDWNLNLFYGGIHPSGDPTDFHYDLLLSEARLATIAGISVFGIPLANYIKLGRAIPATGDWSNLINERDEWNSWGGSPLEVLFSTIYVPEVELGPSSFGINHAQYVTNGGNGEVAFYSPCDNIGGVYKEYSNGHHAIQGYGNEGIEAIYAMFLALPFARQKVLKVLEEAEQIKGAYSDSLGFVDSVHRRNRQAAPTRLAFGQATIMAVLNNDLNGQRLHHYFAPQIHPDLQELIRREMYPPAVIA